MPNFLSADEKKIDVDCKSNSAKNYLGSIRDYILLVPFFLLFIGDLHLPVGEGDVTIPSGMIFISLILLWSFLAAQITLTGISLLLLGLLFCGGVGFLLTPEASFLRSTAGALPIVFAFLTIIAYEKFPIPQERAIKYMMAGGFFLAASVILLFIYSFGHIGDYYEQKLIIETPLGRSNYLAAFLIFIFALSLPRNIIISMTALVAIFCTMSRGGVLALIAFFVIFIFFRKRKIFFLMMGMVFLGLMVASVIFFGGFNEIKESIDFQDLELESVVNRFNLWAFGADVFLQNPIFGVGPNTFRTFVEMAGNIEDVWGVHNSVLLILLNYGVLGLVFYVIYLIIIYKNIYMAEMLDKRFFYLRIGFLTLLVFGLYEPLIGSAAFELLLVFIFVLARSRIRMVAR